jgi:hypothetical protein
MEIGIHLPFNNEVDMLFRELFPPYALSEQDEVSHRIGIIIELIYFR